MGKPVTIKRITKAITTAGQSQKVTTKEIYVPWFEVYAPEDNQGVVYIGDKKVDDTYIPIKPDHYRRYEIGGEMSPRDYDHYKLKKIFLNGQNVGDKIIIQYPSEV